MTSSPAASRRALQPPLRGFIVAVQNDDRMRRSLYLGVGVLYVLGAAFGVCSSIISILHGGRNWLPGFETALLALFGGMNMYVLERRRRQGNPPR